MTTPTPEELASLAESQMRSDLRALATEIAKQIGDASSGGPFIKGIVSSVDWNSIPPLITVHVGGDTTTPISGVRVLDGYAPVAGQTVLLLKQGSTLLAVGHIADQHGFNIEGGQNGWVRATLANGTHNANGQGDVCYRRVLDHGSWKMEWRGGWAPGGATVMVSGLPEEYRPIPVPGGATWCIRTVLCARDAIGSNAVKMDFDGTGQAVIVGGALSITGADGTTAAGGADNHTHNLDASHVHSSPAPTWVSLSGVSYYL